MKNSKSLHTFTSARTSGTLPKKLWAYEKNVDFLQTKNYTPWQARGPQDQTNWGATTPRWFQRNVLQNMPTGARLAAARVAAAAVFRWWMPVFLRHDSFICMSCRMNVTHVRLVAVHLTAAIAFCRLMTVFLRHDSFLCVTWRIHMCDMTHSYAWHNPHTWRMPVLSQYALQLLLSFVVWCLFFCDMTPSCAWDGAFLCATWLMYMADACLIAARVAALFVCVCVCVCVCVRVCVCVYQSLMRFASWCLFTRDMTYAICMTWLIYMTHVRFVAACVAAAAVFHRLMPFLSSVRHDAFICATWLIHMCDMAHSYVRHGSFICATWLIHTCDMSHSYEWHGLCIWLMYILLQLVLQHALCVLLCFANTYLFFDMIRSSPVFWHESFLSSFSTRFNGINHVEKDAADCK